MHPSLSTIALAFVELDEREIILCCTIIDFVYPLSTKRVSVSRLRKVHTVRVEVQIQVTAVQVLITIVFTTVSSSLFFIVVLREMPTS